MQSMRLSITCQKLLIVSLILASIVNSGTYAASQDADEMQEKSVISDQSVLKTDKKFNQTAFYTTLAVKNMCMQGAVSGIMLALLAINCKLGNQAPDPTRWEKAVDSIALLIHLIALEEGIEAGLEADPVDNLDTCLKNAANTKLVRGSLIVAVTSLAYLVLQASLQ